MKPLGVRGVLLGAILVALSVVVWHTGAQAGPQSAPPGFAQQPSKITIDYPQEGSIFPPDISPPTFLWRDEAQAAQAWQVQVRFADGSPPISVRAQGEPMRIGTIDRRAVSETNELPTLTPQQAATRTWKPDAATWESIKKRSVGHLATVSITGYSDTDGTRAVSHGAITISTSPDPVGAPIFYRDVPLMPSELEKGFIKPLAKSAIPLIAWRLRNVEEPESRLLLTGMYTCANCHSFSRDGTTLGMDLDGPQNDKGMYALASISREMAIRDEDVVEWSSFLGKQEGNVRLGFMSQVSPDGQHVVTMINGSEAELDPAKPALEGSAKMTGEPRPPRKKKKVVSGFYVANFKDYRFLQVFYPTRGILACYSRATGQLQVLPGADDPRYVHTGAVWSPDGEYLVFARAKAKDPYVEGQPLAERANDPNETQIQFDLYRIPFNNGRGGTPEPVAGASANGMSNSFPKVSPDGRWIVFVQARNGQLMRPDSQLYIVPAAGGRARRMRCNTPLMNSWHSFSPNGRWLVFSSKARSPYTQMYLTHIDEDGQDSPPILVENSTAANRAVNIPEFLNRPPDSLVRIDVPAVDFYRLFDQANELAGKGQYEAAIPIWREALRLAPESAPAHVNLGIALAETGNLDEAMEHYRKAIKIDPNNAEGYNNLGAALVRSGRFKEAIEQYQASLAIDPESAEANNNLGVARARAGQPEEAISSFEKAAALNPESAEFQNNLGRALAGKGRLRESILHFERAIELDPAYLQAHNNMGLVLAASGRLDEAISHYRRILETDSESAPVHENLGRALFQQGSLVEAISHLRRAIELDPGSATALNSLGAGLVQSGSSDEAIPCFEKAIGIDPDFIEAHRNLGDVLHYLKGRSREALAHWREVLLRDSDHVLVLEQAARVLATSPDPSLRDGVAAVALAEHAAELTARRDPAVLDTLAAAYAETGRFPEAIETAQQALALPAESARSGIVQALRSHISRYRQGAPLRLDVHRDTQP